MKKVLIIWAALLAAASCSLKESADMYVDPGFVKNLQQADACVTAAYTPFKTIYALEFAIATEGCTDLFHIMSGTQDAQMDVSPANARFGNTVWEYAYAGVRNANYALWAMDASGVAAEDLASLRAEALTLRAWWYYVLTCFFGDVPYYEDYVADRPTLDKVRHLPRKDAVEIRSTLISQLEAVVDDMPAARPYDLNLQRAGWAFCEMLIAKMAMWNACKDASGADDWWEKAITALEALEVVFGDLTEENYALNDVSFRIKNTPESIFEVQHTYTPGGLQYSSNYAAVLMPYPQVKDDETGVCTFNNVVIPEIGNECTAWQPMRPNAYLHNGLFVKGSVDRRVGWAIVYSWNGKDFSRSWPGPKFWCYGMVNTSDSNNYPILRYADAVLMLAECYNAVGRTDEAIAHLNAVKTRAGIAPYPGFVTKDRLLEEIQMERGRELLGEFQRKFDLVRWGVWYKRTYEYSDYDALKNNLRPCHEYYPIPDTEVALSEGALDNKAYEK